MVVSCLLTGFSMSDARYVRSVGKGSHEVDSIPTFLLRMYEEMGREKFQQTWKAFNTRNPDQQDAFLMEDLSQEELEQLGSDFENLAFALSADPKLMELYADFERNLSIGSFMEMDKKLKVYNHLWWGRIKRFLYRKLQKLAQEMILQETPSGVKML